MSIGLEERALCRSRHRRPDARIISPLPNLRLEPGAVAQIVHHPLLEPINGSGLAGSATLRLRGECLDVTVIADRQVHLELRRCRSAEPSGNGSGCGDLLLVVTACGGVRPQTVSSERFDLAMRARFGMLGEADLGQLSSGELGSIGQASLQGLATRDWNEAGAEAASPAAAPDLPGAARGVSEDAYFLRRIKDEIGAALRADAPGVASRHVQIATLMARRLRSGTPADALPVRRTG